MQNDNKASNKSSMVIVAPQIDQATIKRLSTMPVKKISQNQKAMAITEIFDEETQNNIKMVEQFLQKVVKDKMYWTRDIMMFFKIEQEDVNCFLNFHQVYKHTILQKMNNNGFNVEVTKKTGRAGSYWIPN